LTCGLLVSIIVLVGLRVTLMKIDISDILKHSGASLRLDFSESIKINDFIAEDLTLAKPVTFKGTLVNAGGL